MNKLVSIIVPIYNSKKYLERTINSVLNQDYREIEVVLVDDGSNDGSIEVCKMYQLKDNRIKFFNKSNGGVSSARNLGLKNCEGDFITFVDSDDFISNNYISTLLNYQKEENYDIVICNAQDVSEEGRIYERNSVLKKKMDLNKEETIIEFLKGKSFTPVCWGRLYKREIIKNLSFDESMSIAEDGKFFFQAIEKSSKNLLIPESFYYYVIREGSLIHSNYNEKWLDELNFDKQLLEKFKDKKLGKYVLIKYVEFCTRMLLMPNIEEYVEDYKLIQNDLKKVSKKMFSLSGNFKLKMKVIIAQNTILKNFLYNKKG